MTRADSPHSNREVIMNSRKESAKKQKTGRTKGVLELRSEKHSPWDEALDGEGELGCKGGQPWPMEVGEATWYAGNQLSTGQSVELEIAARSRVGICRVPKEKSPTSPIDICHLPSKKESLKEKEGLGRWLSGSEHLLLVYLTIISNTSPKGPSTLPTPGTHVGHTYTHMQAHPKPIRTNQK